MKLHFMIATINCLLAAYVFHTVDSSKDVYSGGFKYLVSYPLKKNWFEAQRFCTYNGMYLVDVPNQAENKRLQHIINDQEFANETSLFFWTSGTDLGSEGNFYWSSSGHPILFSDWYTGQPDNSGQTESDNCLEIRANLNFQWNDDLCSELKYFICRDTIILQETKKSTKSNKLDPTSLYNFKVIATFLNGVLYTVKIIRNI